MALGKQTSAVGTRSGKKRHRSDPTVRRRETRLAQPRVANALAAAAAERDRIAALVASLPTPELEAQTVVLHRAVKTERGGIAVVEVEATRPAPALDLTSMAEGDKGWTLGQARLLYQDGYSVAHVVARTGWGAGWLRDLMGRDGYYAGLPVLAA
jgi:hypothetical protein